MTEEHNHQPNPLLEIQNLWAGTEEKEIIRNLSLKIFAGEVHAIMGQNGSGKSTLSYVLAGKPGYVVREGRILFKGKNLLELAPEERAGEGLFLAFQYPVEIPGLNMSTFLKQAVNEVRAYRGLPELDAKAFLKLQKEKLAEMGLSPDFLRRSVNEGFSGGEKKKNEILQMALLEPSLVILDETDSGLDLDAIRQVTAQIERMKTPDRAFIIITHYPKLLDYLKPDVVHIMNEGTIVRSGGSEIIRELEEKGYEMWKREMAIS
jgi:Fe-S cluster assembly ATP-binding protein